MTEQGFANTLLAYLCVFQPALAFAIGVLVGRHGLRRGLTVVLVKIFGQAPPDVERGQ